MNSTPTNSIEDLPGVFSSPKTPVKKFKTRAKSKDTICLTCGICLIGERCTYNLEQHSVLWQKLEFILEKAIDYNANSCRLCRPCGRRVEVLEKKFKVVMEQVRDLRGKYSSACRKNITVKRMSKASPSPKAYKKPRQGQMSLSSSKDGNDDLMGCFQPLPDIVMESSKSTPIGEAVHMPMAGDDNSASEKVPVQVSVHLASVLQKVARVISQILRLMILNLT